MREDILLEPAAQEAAPKPTRKRWPFYVGASITIMMLSVMAIFICLFLFRGDATPQPPKLLDNSHYLNHYSVDEKSIKGDKYSVSFNLLLDTNPDYGQDIIKPTETNPELKELRAEIITETDHRLHVKITDSEKERFEVPINTQDISYNDQDSLLGFQRFHLKNSGFSYNKERFALKLFDRDMNNSIFSTENTYFRYMEKYLVIEFALDSDKLFGLGERLTGLNLRDGNYTLYTRDQGTIIETRSNPGNNLYGSHPFLFYQLKTGLFAGIFFKTSNALQVNINNQPDTGNTLVRFSTIGGLMEFYSFYKGNPQFILKQYHEIIGKPILPPLWSLGYHYGRSGLKNINELKELIQNFTSNGIPLDSIWLDSEILEDGKNFMLNQKDFNGLKELMKYAKQTNNIHFVSVLEPGIKSDPNYEYFSKMSKDGLLAQNSNQSPFIGKTHIGKVGFPNFWKEETCEIWQEGIKKFNDQVDFDGFWLNLNEFSQICDGHCQEKLQENSLPFVPGDTSLEKNALPLDTLYPTGTPAKDKFMTEFNLHQLNSIKMAKATLNGMNPQQKRAFLASRSTYPGIQKFASAHWLGETTSDWVQLKHSIPAIMQFSMFGMPLSGASVCGVKGQATEDLCSKWTQLGLLYPLSLNLNKELHTNSLFGMSNKFKGLTVNAIQTKYSLLRYIYTQIFEQSLYGGAAVQPLFFEFPNDPLAYRSSDRTFMYGKSLLMTTPLEASQQAFSVYFPNSNWFKLPEGTQMLNFNENKTSGTLLHIDVSNERPNIFVKGGSILPYQDAIGLKVKNVAELNDMPMNLIIALDEKNEASGRMIVDDGISGDTIESTKYRQYSYTFSKKTLKVMIMEGHNYTNSYPFENFASLQIWGATAFQNISSACLISNVMGRRGLKTEYNAEKNILTVFDNSRRKYSWKNIETIAIFSDDDYNYCLGGFVASKIKITDQLRRMTAVLDTGFDVSERKYRMDAILMNNYVLNLKISPTNWKAWEVPEIVDEKMRNSTNGTMAFAEYLFAISMDPDPFFFAIANPGDPEDTTITTQDMPLVLDEHFIEVSTLVKATDIYGLGERVYPHFELKNGMYTLHTHDAVSPIEDGEAPGKNMYGSHPFYMFRMPDGSFGGVFMLNSNAMDVSIMPFDEGVVKVDHVSTGGLIDMFIIQRGTPKLILEQYHNLIGRPHLQPFWAFGNHQSRYGYHSQQKLKEVVDKYTKAKLPLEAIWTDIDYFEDLNPFTLDKERYPSMQEFVDWLHQRNIKMVPIVEAAIPIIPENKAYQVGLEKGAFINRGQADKTFEKYAHVVGVVWPGYSTFVDFVNPKSREYWVEMLEYMYEKLFPFDGIWLDMNEVTSFCDGECDLNGENRKPLQVNNNKYKNLPYIPGHRNLQQKALPLDAHHYSQNPGDSENYVEYNLHSMFGHYEMRATNEYFRKHNQRPFIISRSTFPGSGKYGSHWLGDNKSLWEFMNYSIIGIYNFQLFGIPFVGSDVCGYAGNATTELCQRWYQLAAFYPFCRNHNGLNTTDQEPYSNDQLAGTAQVALQLRYSLIRYMYSLHTETSMKGGAYFMPLFYEFTTDPEALKSTDTTFMLGAALKISPIMTPSTNSISSYFPNTRWFNLLDGTKIYEYDSKATIGKNITLQAPLSTNNINVHIRGGKIIPIQDTIKTPATTTRDLHDMTTGFIVAPDHLEKAEGFVIYDDENEYDSISKKVFKVFNITYQKGKMMFDSSAEGTYELNRANANKDESLGEIKVFGAKIFKSIQYACANLHTNAKVKLDAIFDAQHEVLTLKPTNSISIGDLRSIVWDGEHIEC